eukprot:TRINITY_DN18746_c0_g1_i1.p1 TRINITY_DN18746_c0_g1~~TRINITY_DN18746_c0_g1_i1.p1  ORF type:complete len:282 (-),score=48.83 TRINITY_DN18746_c0_g1_i1:499-1344(-)
MGAACCAGEPHLSSIVGPPTAATVRPGQCAFGEEPDMATLIDRQIITYDTFVVTFQLKDTTKPLGLSTCSCMLAIWKDTGGDPIVRPYTPISTNALIGKFQLLIKLYPDGKMSNYLYNLKPGSPVLFKHIPVNVKIQYPFNYKHITMLVGGTGITPMIQALHAILGTPGDTTKVSLIFGNKRQEDILGKEILDKWARNSGGRLVVTHVLSDAGEDASWNGHKGFITADLIKSQTPDPSQDVLIMVCGPPPMYDALCGPRTEKEVTGALGAMGYKADQVYKF